MPSDAERASLPFCHRIDRAGAARPVLAPRDWLGHEREAGSAPGHRGMADGARVPSAAPGTHSSHRSRRYLHRLAEYGIAASMSRKGNCYDNAVAESFFSTLKNDLVHERDYQTREEARAEIFEFIEVFYNRQRLHQMLGYVSPEQFETQNPVPIWECLRNRG
jgi:transposase InsO family protein